jgi:hypothetical protein
VNARLKYIALVLLVLGALALSIRQYRRIGFFRAQIATRLEEAGALESLAKKMTAQRAAYDWITRNARTDDSVADIIKRNLAGAKSDLVLRESAPLGEGWNVRRYDLRIGEISPDLLQRFLIACETALPPVKLLDLQASPHSDSRSNLLVQIALAEMIPLRAEAGR